MSILTVYVGEASKINLDYGLKNNIWGFKESVSKDLINEELKGSYLVLAFGFTGGSPRKSEDEWKKYSLNKVYIGRIKTNIYNEKSIEWPDEKYLKENERYSNRFRFDLISEIENVEIKSIPTEIAEGIRKSGIAQSRGYFIKNINWDVIDQSHQDALEINDSSDLSYKKNILEINDTLDLPHQKIIYGAPGTGKSNSLRKEVSKIFKDFIIEKTAYLDQDSEPNYWSVGCTVDEINRAEEMLENNEWFTNDSKAIDKIKNEVNIGDFIALKSSFVKERSYSVSRVFGIGKVLQKEPTNEGLKIEWIKKYLPAKEFENIYLSGTIKRVLTHKEIIFADILNLKNKIIRSEIVSSYERVTFYDGYTYGQFVGAYKPYMEENEIVYKYVPGPILRLIKKAYEYPNKKFVLIIEEINRAKVDRVFGDIFQLLDRDSKGDSEYPISMAEELKEYLVKNLEEKIYQNTIVEKKGLYLPNNLYIWATMNSSDQGVYPMDTAFKRRWDFEYLSLNQKEDEMKSDLKIKIDNTLYDWNIYRRVLNDFLGESGITEDRLISPFFLKEKDFDQNTKILKNSIYTNKFLMYIFDDILKHNTRLKDKIFKARNFYIIFEKFRNNESIYTDDFIMLLKKENDSVGE